MNATEGKMKSAFDKIAAGLNEAIAYAEGDTSRGRVATIDVRAVRAATKLSQDKFAKEFRFSASAVRDWEQGRRQPEAGAATLLKMIEVDPAGVQKILAKVES
jgi:putative transcriptional regulator